MCLPGAVARPPWGTLGGTPFSSGRNSGSTDPGSVSSRGSRELSKGQSGLGVARGSGRAPEPGGLGSDRRCRDPWGAGRGSLWLLLGTVGAEETAGSRLGGGLGPTTVKVENGRELP